MTAIVITGIGLISPAGLSLEASRSAAFPLKPSEDTTAFPPHPDLPRVTPVTDQFSLKGIVKKRKTIKLMARANQFAVAATDEAIKTAELPASLLSSAGMFMAIGREPSDLNALLPSVMNSTTNGQIDLNTLFTEGVNWINPLSSLKTLPNMSLAHAAIHVGLMGPNMALYGPDAFSKCIESARTALDQRRCEIAFVGGADSCTSLFDRLALAREFPTEVAGEGAAMFILETRDSASRRGAKIFAELDAIYNNDGVMRFGYCGAATQPMSV
ncbi:MAG: beta-ketoacyl synthase N-terminal-like domain-containing protein, partial [Bradymonadia bacterium]